ncbi:copper amine oxidase N-terminal domain-containing protein [Paenibacillus wenxiniae]|uniref:Copper amine oxidase N-terminal domain-containing protein n=1 Tax=Paenibacillus wenxiniae TaxID=1636843 RepID=A0ABW4RE14_9BACL
MNLKKLSSTFLLTMMLIFTVSNLAHASLLQPNVYVNNQKMDIYAHVSVVGVTYVPFRPIFSKLNMTVNWDNAKKSVTATDGTTTIVLTNNSYTAYVNGKAVQLINPPVYNPDDKLFYVNLRFVAESTGAVVNWSKTDTDANIYITNPNLK